MSLIDDSIAAYLGRFGEGNSYYDESADRNHAAIWTQNYGTVAKPEWVIDDVLNRPVLDFPESPSNLTNNNFTHRAPHAVAFEEVTPQSGSFSVAFWHTGGGDGVMGTCHRSGETGWVITLQGGTHFRIDFRGESGSTHQLIDNSRVPNTTLWNCFIANVNITGNNVDLFINGLESVGYFAVADFTGIGSFQSYWNRLHIGGMPPLASNYYNPTTAKRLLGPMIFDRLLTSAEIAELQTPPAITEFGSGEAGFTGLRGVNRRLGT